MSTVTLPLAEVTEHLLRIGSLEDAAHVLNVAGDTTWSEAFAHHPRCCAPLGEGTPLALALGSASALLADWRRHAPAAEGSAWEELEHLRATLGTAPTEDPFTELYDLRCGWSQAAEAALLGTDTA